MKKFTLILSVLLLAIAGTATSQDILSLNNRLAGDDMLLPAADAVQKKHDVRKVVTGKGLAFAVDEVREYSRIDGFGLMRNNSTTVLYNSSPIGATSVFAFSGNKVYLQNAIFQSSVPDTWIEGTVSEDGTKLTFPVGQEFTLNGETKTGSKLCVLRLHGSLQNDETVTQITYTVDKNSNTIVMDFIEDGTGNYFFISASSDEDEAQLYAECYTTFKHFPKTAITPPADMRAETWKLNAVDYVGTTNGMEPRKLEYDIQFGVSGSEAWVKGVLPEFPDVWVKGDISGRKCKFTTQYLGELETYGREFYFLTLHIDREYGIYDYEITFTYNPESNTYAIDDDSYVLLNAMPVEIMYIRQLGDIVISKVEQDAIDDVATDRSVVSESYITLSGTKVQNPQHGIFVKNIRYADGTVKNVKVKK